MNIVEQGPSPTILIVDDNPANSSVIADYLTDYGFQVMVAQAGETALELAQQVRPELILLDVMLPGIDGFEVCRRLKADEQTQEIPVIFTTVLAEVEDKVKGFEVGGVDYISKPFQEQEVLARVTTHLRLRNLTGRLHEAKEALEKRVAERTAALVQANRELQAEIVERKRAEEALKEQHSISRSIIDSADTLIFSIDRQYRYTSFNKGHAAVMKAIYGAEIKVGHSLLDYMTVTEDRETAKGNLDRALAGEQLVEEAYSGEELRSRQYFRVSHSPIKTEAGQVIGVAVLAQDITERKRAEEALRESEKRVRRKLDAILSPEADISALELSDIIDSEKVQKLMDEFYQLTNVGIGIIDLHGKVLVGTGWQDICTKFHRVNPESRRLCIESDLELSSNVPVGTFKQYRCKNNMWDIATPIMLGNEHVGNIFLGQFLFDDETPDYKVFRQQARRYGFNEQEYIAALDRVPRWSRKTVNAAMSFYTALAGMIGDLSYSSIKLANALEERKRAEEALQRSEQRKTILNQIANVFLTVPDDEMYAEVLAVVLQVMESKFGLFGFVGANDDLVIPSLTRGIWNECQIPDKSIVFPPDKWGDSLWGKAVREKKAFYSDGPFHIPAGHIHIDNFLTVPIVFGNETIGIISFANRARGYTKEDQDLLEDITSYISPILNARLQRDQQEQERKRTEETLRAIIRAAPTAIIGLDLDGNVQTVWNPAAEKMLGWSAQEAMGHPLPSVPLESQEEFRGFRERIRSGQTLDGVDVRRQRRDGSPIDYSIYASPLHDAEGRITGNIAVLVDITERRRAEEALSSSEAELRTLIQAMTDIIIVGNSEGRYLKIVDTSPSLLYRPPNELLGKTLREVFPKDQANFFLNHIRQALNTQKSVNFEYSLPIGNKEIWFNATISPMSDDKFLMVARDITDRKRAEEELRAHRDHLEELVRERTAELTIAKDAAEEARRLAEAASQAKSAFLAQMSHELRTPLNAILGYAQILQRRPLEPEVIDALNTVQRSGKHLLTLVNDILDIARIEAGKMKLSPAPIHFPNFLDHIASIVRARAEAKGLAFAFEKLNALPAGVQADETRLRQILLNLLDNAVKFTDEGQVTLRVSSKKYEIGSKEREQPTEPLLPTPHSPLPTPYSLLPTPYSLLRFEVQDTGIGIPPDQWERIFQPFEQVEDVSRPSKGTGLGLAISRQLVRLMGSELHVHSELGRGSTFWFEVALPVTEVAREAARPLERGITGYKGPRRAVLVVDDIPSNRAVLVDLLAPLGFDVIEAADGQQALHLARELHPDLILMDRWMPVLDGFEATRQLRQIPELARVPTIAISASVLEQNQAQSREAGINAFLPKPVNWVRLAALLEEYLRLEWEYEEETETRDREEGEAVLVPPPPQEELAILLDLAMRGNMQAIRERADYLEQADEKLGPFVVKLRQLAKDFEDKAILALVRRYMEGDR
jgi:PAS domain S-box-containing protein